MIVPLDHGGDGTQFAQGMSIEFIHLITNRVVVGIDDQLPVILVSRQVDLPYAVPG